jgi:steroid delta-isomerase-like uncharacterized protein
MLGALPLKGAAMSEQNKAVVLRLIEDHWNGKNQALVGEVFAPTAVLQTPDGDLTGLEGASFLLQAYATAFPDFHIAIEDVIAEGNEVVARWTFTGTHAGPFLGVPATGKPIKVANGIGIFQLAGDKVTEGHFAWNTYSVLQQIGALPSTAVAAAV